MLKAVIACAFISTVLLSLFVSSTEYQTNEVGFSSGQLQVSESGAAQYHVPISLPSGVAGVKPQVALSYNSQGGDGSLGVGWSLSAGSAIVRCGQNFVNDGKNLGVDYSTEDRFCYGGQRLIPNNSQSNYYTPGTSYHTEIDNFSIITGVGGSTSTGPQYFTVETKSGETHYFGNSGHPNSADAFVQTQQNAAIARYWSIKAIEDVKNNIILFNYTEDVTKGRHQLSQITYGGYRTNSVSQVINNSHSVNFHYANNPTFDNKTGYIAGNLVGSDVHLSRIEVKQDNDVYRNYHLTYELPAHVEDKKYLTAIQECLDGTTSHCLAPMKFDWQKQTSSSTFELVNTSPSTHGSSYMREGGSFVDLTGDGKPELIYPNNYSGWSIYGADANGNYSTVEVANSHTSNSKMQHSRVIDYNGDGRNDFLFIRSNNQWAVITAKAGIISDACNQMGSQQLCTNQTQTFTFETVDLNLDSYNKEKSMIMDIEGDGFHDIVFSKYNTIKYHKNLGGTNGFAAEQTLTISSTTSLNSASLSLLDKATSVDINGDGIPDLVIDTWSGGTTKIILVGTGTGFEEYASFSSRGGSELYGFTPVDFNGDGLTDFAYIYNNKWHYRLSTGTGLTEQVQLKIAPSMGSTPSIDINGDYADFYNQHRFADINGDGKTDVIAYREQYPQSYYDYSISYIDTNGQVQFVQRGTQQLAFRGNLSFADINGDGTLDIMSRQNAGDAWEKYDALPNKTPFAVITGVNNGFAPKTTLDYALINDPSVAISTPSTNNTSADYADITSGVYVVRQVETENSATSNTTNKVSYAYGGALVHKKGRGFLGFEVL
ncbi:hypothetical protein NBRC116592_21270 [Colwellia sp. KU-HH00111]|uniref:FG-GAP-like repeat-containing protein n=1 Tax=Colwellia sp. KU-HH00111 TaxID=3127652 RepID=UPI003103F18C